MSTVFLSYRRRPGKWVARLLCHELSANGFSVFLDVDHSGRFGEVGLRQIAARTHFILLLEPGDLKGCLDPNDLLRREIEQALAIRRNITPVTAEKFSFEEERPYLTAPLAQIMAYPAVALDYLFFENTVEELRDRILRQPFHGRLVLPPASDQAIVTHLAQTAWLTIQPTGYHLTILVPALNIRFGPGMHYTQISAIREGRQPPILGRNHDNTWWMIEHRQIRGWVTEQFVEIPAGVDLTRIPILD